MPGNITAGAAVTVNPTSSVGNFFSGTTRENVYKFFSTWSGRGMEHIQNIGVKMQKSNYKALHIFVAVNLSFLCVVKYAIHPFLERHLEEKNDDTKNQRLAKRSIKVLVVGAILTAANFAFAKLAKYPLNNIVLFTTVAAALIGYLVLIKPISIHKPETPEQRAERAARLNAEATRLEGEATAAETAANETAATLANRIAERTVATDDATQQNRASQEARTRYLEADQKRLKLIPLISGAEGDIRQQNFFVTMAQETLAKAKADLAKEEGLIADLAQLRQIYAEAVEIDNKCEAEFEAARETETIRKTELANAKQNQTNNQDDSQNDALAESVRIAQIALEEAVEARQKASTNFREASAALGNACNPIYQVLLCEGRVVKAQQALDEAILGAESGK